MFRPAQRKCTRPLCSRGFSSCKPNLRAGSHSTWTGGFATPASSQRARELNESYQENFRQLGLNAHNRRGIPPNMPQIPSGIKSVPLEALRISAKPSSETKQSIEAELKGLEKWNKSNSKATVKGITLII